MPRPFAVIGFTLFFSVAILCEFKTGVTAAASAVFAVALVIALLIEKTRSSKVLPVAFATGLIACLLLLANDYFVYRPLTVYDGETHTAKFELTDEPYEQYGNYYVNANAVEIDGKKADFKARLSLPEYPDAEPYDTVEGNFAFYRPGYTSEEYLAANKADGIFVGAYPEGESIYKHIDSSAKGLRYRIYELRKAIKFAIFEAISGKNAGLINAMVLGDKRDISDEVSADLRMSGLSHIICVSGLHLSLWAGLFLSVFDIFGFKRKTASLLTVLGVIAVMNIVVFSYSVIRAGIMTVIYLLARAFLKGSDSLNSLGFAVTAILLFNPYSASDIGLQLSVLSTLGIILYNEIFAKKIRKLFSGKAKNEQNKFLFAAVNSLGITLAAVLFIQPVSLRVFGNFNFVVFLSNTVVTPAVGFCMITGVLAAATVSLPFGIHRVFAVPSSAAADYIVAASGKFSDIEKFNIILEYEYTAVILAATLALTAFFVIYAYFCKAKPALSVFLVSAVFFSSLLVFSHNESKLTRVTVADTGNGISVMVSKNGENILFGSGGDEFNSYSKTREMISFCGKAPDAFIIPDSSDYSSKYAYAVLRDYAPENVMFDDLPLDCKTLINEAEGIPLSRELITDELSVKTYTENNMCVSLIKTDDISILICYNPIDSLSSLPDDMKNFDIIISRGDYPGDITSGSPKAAIISCANRRGMLIQRELGELGVYGAVTAGCGNIVAKADGQDISIYRE